jgi:sodium transport system permease protein
MRLNKIGTIFRKEALDTLRDRRTLFTMIIIPLLLYPGLMLFINSLAASQQVKMEQKTIRIVMVNIPNDSALSKMLRAEKRIEIVTSAQAARDVREGRVDFVLQGPLDFESLIRGRKTAKIQLFYDRSNDDAMTNLDRIKMMVDRYEKELLTERLQEKQLDNNFIEPVTVEEVNVATKRKMGGFVISRFLPMLMVFMVLVGALYPSIDMTAGEKERGTLETILTSPATKGEIVLGKFLTVSLIAMITGLLNLGSMMATFTYGIFSGMSEAIQIKIPIGYVLVMFLCMVPLAVFFSGVMMAIASFARSFKEAQTFVSPFYLIATLPAMISSIPGIRLEGFWLTTPIANVVLLFKELMLGILNWPHIFIVLFTMSFLASVAIFAAIQLFGREEVLFGEAASFGLSFKRSNINPKPVPVPSESLFFAMVSLALLIYVALPLQMRDLVSGLIFTEVVLFFALPVAFAIYLKLDLRQTFRLRAPSGKSVLITLLLFAGIVLSMSTIVYIQNRLFPFPKELLDYFQKISQEIYSRPFWQSFALIALLPAVCEETTFRGVVFAGFLNRKKPWVAMFLTALLFGIFHLSLHRFPGVFLIGFAACFAVWISGSIFTGMLLHALCNGFVSLISVYPQYDFIGISAERPSFFALLGVILIVAGVWIGAGKSPERSAGIRDNLSRTP